MDKELGASCPGQFIFPPYPEFLKSFAERKINQPGQLAPNPSDKDNQTECKCNHLSLTEIMFTSLTTKYSKIMVQ